MTGPVDCDDVTPSVVTFSVVSKGVVVGDVDIMVVCNIVVSRSVDRVDGSGDVGISSPILEETVITIVHVN